MEQLQFNRQKISRIDLRQRRSATEEEETSVQESVRKRESSPAVSSGEEEDPSVVEPLLIREKRKRQVMGKKHLMFHRRQAESSQAVSTVIVDIIATVDGSGNVIGTETMSPNAAVPSNRLLEVPPGLPVVPQVPPFPSDLTPPAVPPMPSVNMPVVPSFPFPSGVPSIVTPGPTVLSAPQTTPLPLGFTGGFNATSSGTLCQSWPLFSTET